MLIISRLLLHTKRNALFYIGLFLLSLLFFLQWKFGFLYAWVDIAPDEIDPALNLYRSMFLWHDHRGLGINYGFYNGMLLPLFFKYLVFQITKSSAVVSFIYYYLIFILPFFSSYYLVKRLLPNTPKIEYVATLSALLYQILFGNYLLGNHPLFMRYSAFITLPFLWGSLIDYFRGNTTKSIILLLIAIIGCTGTFINTAFSLIFYIVILIYLLIYFSPRKFWKKYILAGMLFVIINAPFLYSTGKYYLDADLFESEVVREYTNAVLSLNLSKMDNSWMYNTLRLIGTVNWNAKSPWSGYTEFKYPYYPFYQNHMILPITFFPILFICFSLYKHKPKSLLLYLVSIIIVTLFIMKGSNNPFGSFFSTALSHLPFFSIFRTPYDKVVMLTQLSFAVIISYYFFYFIGEGKSKIKLLIIMVLFISVQMVPLFRGQYFEKIGFINYEKERLEAYDYINKMPGNNRVLTLPQSNGLLTQYSNGYFGYSLESSYIKKPLFEFSFVGHDRYTTDAVQSMLSYTAFQSGIFKDLNVSELYRSEQVRAVKDILERYGFEYILYDRTKIGDGAYVLSSLDYNNYLKLLTYLVEDGFIVKTGPQNGLIDIYRVNYFNPLVYSRDLEGNVNELEYYNLDPTKVLINVKEHAGSNIYFNQSYNKGWVLIPIENIPCIPRYQSVNIKDIGCSALLDIYSLFLPEIEDTKHTPYGNLNSWDISGNDSESFIIYYKYQRIYTILGLVSATVVMGLFFYLILGKYIRK